MINISNIFSLNPPDDLVEWYYSPFVFTDEHMETQMGSITCPA